VQRLSLTNEPEGNEDLAEINIVPLVDVLLVLLVIFMITAPMSIGGIKVQLPLSQAKGNAVDEDRIVLSINKEGEYYIGEKMKVAPEALPEKFKAMYEFRKKKELFIRADKEVEYGRVVYAMSSAKLAGVNKLAMLTKFKGEKK
jgi:biopolymer transport protein TolR